MLALVGRRGAQPLTQNLADVTKESLPELSRTLDEHAGFAIGQRNYFVHNLCERLQDYTTDDFSVSEFRSQIRGLIRREVSHRNSLCTARQKNAAPPGILLRQSLRDNGSIILA